MKTSRTTPPDLEIFNNPTFSEPRVGLGNYTWRKGGKKKATKKGTAKTGGKKAAKKKQSTKKASGKVAKKKSITKGGSKSRKG